MHLYELSTIFAGVQAEIEEGDPEAAQNALAKVDLLAEAFEEKAMQVAYVLKNMQAMADAMGAEADRMRTVATMNGISVKTSMRNAPIEPARTPATCTSAAYSSMICDKLRFICFLLSEPVANSPRSDTIVRIGWRLGDRRPVRLRR